MKSFIPFAKPEIGKAEIKEVLDTLNSGWLTTGKKTVLFEQLFQKYLGKDIYAVSVNSATAGLHLALEACQIKAGDEVITTPFTFTATAEVIKYMGAHPVFIDIDPETYNIDTRLIEKAITPRTKAILPVHFAGLSCDLNKIYILAKKYRLKVIEDAAHALPSTYQKKLIGTHRSDAVVFSFYANKTMTTGEGGMIVTRNKAIASRCKIMRLHGINRDIFNRYISRKPNWFYEVIAPGYKYNLTDIASSIGIHQLKKVENFREKREKIAKLYLEGLKDLPLILPAMAKKEDVHSWHLFTIQTLHRKINRDQLIKLLAEKNIGTSVHFIPLHLHPYWKKTYKLKETDFPQTTKIYKNILSLPIYSSLSFDETKYIIKTLRDILSA